MLHMPINFFFFFLKKFFQYHIFYGIEYRRHTRFASFCMCIITMKQCKFLTPYIAFFEYVQAGGEGSLTPAGMYKIIFFVANY